MMNYATEDIHTLARTIWGEARGENMQGRIGVAWVVLNRTARRAWPDRVAEVCTQPKQFSCWNPGDPNLPKLLGVGLDSASYRGSMFAALGVLDGVFPDPTGGADHYHAEGIFPWWAEHMPITQTIGAHIFLTSTTNQGRGA